MLIRRFLFLVVVASGLLSQAQKKKKEQAVVPQSQKDSVKLESILIEAEKQLMLENYSKSLENFTVALSMNSESAPIHYKLAEVLVKSEQGQKAIPHARKAVELSPENKYYYLSLARTYQAVGFYIEAAKAYEEMLQPFASDENALYELAELYQLMGRMEDMFRTFDKIEKQLGIKEEIVREKQRIYMREGKVDEVIDEYKKLCNAYPHEPAYKLELISFLIQNKKTIEAEEAILQYEQQEGKSSRVTLLKSELAWMNGQQAESLELLLEGFESKAVDFETKFQIISNYLLVSTSADNRKKLTDLAVLVARQYPMEFKAQAFAGDLLFQQGENEQAVSFYLDAVDISPANFSVWQNVLNVEANMGMFDSVVVHSERALEYFPNQALLYYFAGTGHLVNQDYKKSVRMLEQGRKFTIDPALLTSFYGQLGDAYNGLKDNQKSYAAYEKALENQADNDHVLNNYSYFLSLDRQNLDRALEMSTKLVEAHPSNPTYLDTHGWVLYTVGDYKASKKYLEKAVSLDGEEDSTLIEHYGDVLFQLGDVDGAIAQWEKARNLGNASEFIDKKITDRKLYE